MPVAWVITNSGECEAIYAWMLALQLHMHNHYEAWKPSAFLVDDAQAEIMAIERAWGPDIQVLAATFDTQGEGLENTSSYVSSTRRYKCMLEKVSIQKAKKGIVVRVLPKIQSRRRAFCDVHE